MGPTVLQPEQRHRRLANLVPLHTIARPLASRLLLAPTVLIIHQPVKLLLLPVFRALQVTSASVQQALPKLAIQVTTAH